MGTRPFGNTGVSLPILSLGCQRLVDEEGCGEDRAVEILLDWENPHDWNLRREPAGFTE